MSAGVQKRPSLPHPFSAPLLCWNAPFSKSFSPAMWLWISDAGNDPDQEAARALIRYSLSPCSLVKIGAFL